MKKILSLILLVSFVGYWVYASHPWVGKTMSVTEVKSRWGDVQFDEARFKKSDPSARASMAYSLMTGKKMVGIPVKEVRARLGDFDGHYFSEMYPTYLIEVASQKGEDTWQIVFLIDRDRKTKDVIVHKNCCD